MFHLQSTISLYLTEHLKSFDLVFKRSTFLRHLSLRSSMLLAHPNYQSSSSLTLQQCMTQLTTKRSCSFWNLWHIILTKALQAELRCFCLALIIFRWFSKIPEIHLLHNSMIVCNDWWTGHDLEKYTSVFICSLNSQCISKPKSMKLSVDPLWSNYA